MRYNIPKCVIEVSAIQRNSRQLVGDMTIDGVQVVGIHYGDDDRNVIGSIIHKYCDGRKPEPKVIKVPEITIEYMEGSPVVNLKEWNSKGCCGEGKTLAEAIGNAILHSYQRDEWEQVIHELQKDAVDTKLVVDMIKELRNKYHKD